MPSPKTTYPQPSAAVLALYNAVPSVLWSGLAWGPVGYFAYTYVAHPWLYGFGAASLLAYAWPAAWLRRLQLSSHLPAYQRLGVPGVGRITQNGAFIQHLLRRRYPQYRQLVGRGAAAKLVRTTYQQERFHWAALLFFVLVSGYAGATGQAGWALGISVLNVGYNLYPIWLQQYLRMRLRRLAPGTKPGYLTLPAEK